MICLINIYSDIVIYVCAVDELLEAAKDNKPIDIDLWVKKGGVDVNTRHTLGWTPLMVAAVNGNVNAVKVLLELGADPNLKEEFSTVYHVAKLKHLNPIDGNKLV